MSETIPESVISVTDFKTKWNNIFTNYIKPLKDKNPNIPIIFLEFGYTDSIKAPYYHDSDTFAERVFTDMDENGLDDGQEMQANISRIECKDM